MQTSKKGLANPVDYKYKARKFVKRYVNKFLRREAKVEVRQALLEMMQDISWARKT